MTHKSKFKSVKKIILLLTLLIIHYTFNIENCFSQSWSPLGSGLSNFAITVIPYNGNLIAGGGFLSPPPMYYIGKWNGNQWSSFGSSGILNNTVRTLTLYNGNLIAGGDFTTAGGVTVNKIAKWNDTNWVSLGGGVTGGSALHVDALIVFDGKLIVGGLFDTPYRGIAKWDGNNWTTLGGGVNLGAGVHALTIYNGELIAGGSFNTIGGVSANYIAKWNGTTWSPLGSGMGGVTFPWVYSLCVYNNELIAGGWFLNANGVSTNYIAKWNGTTWSALGSGMGGTSSINVNSLIVYDSCLIAGGRFVTAGGVTVNHIAKWNGSNWDSLGSGMTGADVSGLTIYNNDLIACGSFSKAGGVNANNIAKWSSLTGINISSFEIPERFSLSQNYPNPFNPITNFKYGIPKNSFVTLKVYDVMGREVSTLVNETKSPGNYSVDFNGSDLTSGVYFYKLTVHQGGSSTVDFTETKRMILLK